MYKGLHIRPQTNRGNTDGFGIGPTPQYKANEKINVVLRYQSLSSFIYVRMLKGTNFGINVLATV